MVHILQHFGELAEQFIRQWPIQTSAVMALFVFGMAVQTIGAMVRVGRSGR